MVDNPIEWNRGNTPPMVELDLQTLESEPALHRAETAIWPTTTKGYVLWALAALTAIVLGVLPALWINRWRDGAAVAAPAPREQPRAAVTEPADQDEAPAPAPPAVEAPTVEAPTIETPKPAHSVASVKANKPRQKPERVKPSTSRARKQQQPTPTQPPPCDVYLHPKGCPR